METHPHKPFVPEQATVLIVGTFPGRKNSSVEGKDEWFYASKRNQFWNIIRGVYGEELLNTSEKKELFNLHGIAIGDIFLKIRRKEKNNADSSLEVVEYNDKLLGDILKKQNFSAIFFTSKFVEKEFKKLFPEVTTGECLPSPSPRYARMSLQEKIEYYRKKLPG